MRGVWMLGVLLVSGCCCREDPAQAAKREQRNAARAAAASASAAALAANRARCGARFATDDWEETCRELVRARLFQPSSADFAIFGSIRRTDEKKCQQFYSSTVESMNAFGATIEHRFICAFDTRKNWVTVEGIGMN